MPNITIPPSVERALRPLMTRKVAYGAAISLAAGIGLGAWLQPPPAHYGSGTTVVTPPPEQANPWGEEVSSVSTLPYTQPETTSGVYQTASVSPPADAGAANDTPTVQPAVQTSTQPSPRQGDDPSPWQTNDGQRQQPYRVAYNSRPAPAPGRDWAEQTGSDGGDADHLDPPAPFRWRQAPEPRWSPPAEQRWAPPPEARPAMQDRHWDFRPDGSAVPLDDGGG